MAITQESIIDMYSKLPLHTRAVAERFEVKHSEVTKSERIGEGGVGQVIFLARVCPACRILTSMPMWLFADMVWTMARHACRCQGAESRNKSACPDGPYKVLTRLIRSQ
jgi:hypothetical protein